jgi:hypothetical protein
VIDLLSVQRERGREGGTPTCEPTAQALGELDDVVVHFGCLFEDTTCRFQKLRNVLQFGTLLTLLQLKQSKEYIISQNPYFIK